MILKYNSGIFFTNTYLIVNDNNEAVIVDPGLSFKDYAKEINKNYQVKAVLLTHGHLDHIDGARFFNCPVYIGVSDLDCFSTNDKSLYKFMNMTNPYLDLNVNLIGVKDKEVIEVSDFKITVIYTPGHTEGSVCYLLDDNLFTGDSLFVYGIPRTDFLTGDENKLKKSFKKLFNFNDNINVYPGHDEKGTIGICKKNMGMK